MGRREDPRERRRAAQEDDPYEHLMDNIDTLLQDDEYEGPDSRRPQRRSVPDQWYDAYGDENDYNDYNAAYDPGYGYPEQPRRPEFWAYNVDFEQPPRQKRRPRPQENHPEYYGGDAGARASGQPRKKKARNDAPRRSAPRPAKKRRHPILKLLLGLLIVLVIACAALWIFAKQPVSSDALGARKPGCSTILLAGTDADGTRTDTMMLLYLDSKNGQMSLMSLPRDTYTDASWSVPKLNSVYGVNDGGKEGMEVLLDYVKKCIGYRPDGYILVDLDCFEKLVDLMGGVRFHVPMDMSYSDPSQDLEINLTAGEQTLSGQQSMWVVRFRSGYAMADLQRVQVQRDFMQAAMAQWSKPTKFLRYPAAASLLASNTTTNLSLRNLVWVGKAVLKAKTNGMRMETLPGEPAMIGGGSYYVEWPETTANLINEAFNPYEVPVSKENIYSPWY